MDNLEFKAFQTASNAFLCEEVPSNWLEMSKADQESFIDDMKWADVEGRSIADILDLIECHSETILKEIKRTLNQVKENIIERTIECEMDSDVNNWDMYSLALSE